MMVPIHALQWYRFADTVISYDYKDYRKGGKHGVMTLYFVSFVAYFEIVASLFVYIVKRNKSVFSSASCHSPLGNHTKTDIFPHNNQITFAAAVLRSGLHIALQAIRSLSCSAVCWANGDKANAIAVPSFCFRSCILMPFLKTDKRPYHYWKLLSNQ